MKLSLLSSGILFAILSSSVSASPLLEKKQDTASSTGYVKIPIQSKYTQEERASKFFQSRRHLRLMKRDSDDTTNSTAQLELYNNWSYGAYMANITIGSPGQSVSVQLDTGSSDLWVQSSSNPTCMSSSTACALTKTFNPSDSSSFKSISEDFQIQYQDGTYALGEYIEDTVTFGDISIVSLQLGLAENATSDIGVFGIGFTANEAASTKYKNFPARLVDDGIIAVNAYSLWLDDTDSVYGNILFGGVDLKKFTGDLMTVDLVAPSYGRSYTELSLSLTAVEFTKANSSANSTSSIYSSSAGITTVLDSGTTFGVLPSSIVKSIASDLGTSGYDEDYGIYIVDCSMQSSDDTVDFTFGGSATIKVPARQIIATVEQWSDGNDVCALGLTPSSDSADSGDVISSGEVYLLGDAFLRGAYVVYDLDNKEISLAQAVYNADSESKIVALNSTGVSGFAGEGTSTSSATSFAVSSKPALALIVVSVVSVLVTIM
ncbi:aspartic peptidase domain-containing protein [Dipodascopsis uninucleata]